MSFLSDISKSIVEAGFSLQETVFVLPNERARRMLLHHLTRNLKLPAFLPAIYSIEHFIDLLSPLQTLDKLELLVELFGCARQMEPPVADSFDGMLSWAPAFLSDIDEIDMQMQDGEYVFKTLAFDKEFTIAMAHLDEKESLKEKMAFYARLAELYTRFRERLCQERKAYSGLKFRDCADNIGKYVEKLHFKHFVFAGFHVFTPSELSVVRYIKDNFDARFFFDIDPFYCDFNQDDRFTTAYFLKKICAGLDIPVENVQFVYRHYEELQKKIQIVGVAKEMNQVYYAVEQLKRIEEQEKTLDGTAVVLADEQMLVPFLSAYGMKDVNVTMGYPIAATPVYTLLTTLLDLYQTALRYSHGGALQFHYRDVVALLRNPVVQKLLFADEAQHREAVAKIEDNQRPLYFQADLPEGCIPEFSADIGTLLPALVRYMADLADAAPEGSQEYAMLNILIDALKIADTALKKVSLQGQTIALSTVKYAIGLQVDSIVLPVSGDPMHGLQVMGLLETRTLDFKHIIMLSVNEGVLPAGISYNTLLPFEIKYDNHSLPNYLYKDQVYAYHFFRLLQRAEDVVLLYNNVSDTSLMEKSRFIAQLEFQKMEQHLDNLQLEYPQLNFHFKAAAPEQIEVEKTEEVLHKLREMEYSATALIQYITCPLQFYFRNVCGIKPSQTFQERIEKNIIGTVVHKLLEEVFNKIKETPSDAGKIIQDFIDFAEERIAQKILADKNLNMQFTPNDLRRGRLYLAVRMVYNDVCRYLQKAERELEVGRVKIVGNEVKAECALTLPDGEIARLYGVVDRLQMNHDTEQNGYSVVVDYKTGKVDDKFLKVDLEKMKDVVGKAEYKQLLQLLVYALLLKKGSHKAGPLSEDLQCGIMCIKDANREVIFPEYWHPASFVVKEGVVDRVTANVLDTFQSSLTTLLSEIRNPKKPFVQTSVEDHCAYCDFKYLCTRG